MMKESFWSLRESATAIYSSMEQLIEEFDWDIFTDEGAVKCEAYGILDDAFRCSDSKTDLVKAVAGEIAGLVKEIKEARENGSSENLEDAAHAAEIVKYLVKYIRHNCEDELWEEYPEFDHNHYTRGW